jgi:1-acyl-sn-glycerol-3-phosphate acyltransferase
LIVLRSTLFNLFFFVVSFCMTVAATVVRLFDPDRVMPHAKAWARVMLWGLRTICNIKVEVVGLEHVPPGAALIASAHQSAFDTFVWLALLPRCCYVFKHELLAIPLFGRLITAVGMIPVDRSAGPSALRSLLQEGMRAQREDRQIVIFPEGTRAPLGASLPLQPGVAALATRTGLAVIPVATNSGHCWGRRAFHKYPGTIRIIVRPALPAGLPRGVLLDRLAEALRFDGVGDGVAADVVA